VLLCRCIPGHHHVNSSEQGSESTSGAVIIAILQQQQPHPLNAVGSFKVTPSHLKQYELPSMRGIDLYGHLICNNSFNNDVRVTFDFFIIA